jgi:hypothetical protein
MACSTVPTYVLLTDAPPLRQGGHGCHVLSWNWLQAMTGNVRRVITHRLNRFLSARRIAAELPVPSTLYPDLCDLPWPGRLATLKIPGEWAAFLCSLPGIRRDIRESGADRLFAFFGGNMSFLFIVRCAAAAARLPLDVYLVDDLEESARLRGHPLQAWWARRAEARVLRQADRIFTISPAYAEHLSAKYGVPATWLPIAINSGSLRHQPFEPAQPDVRRLTFIGAVNALYEEALRDCLRAIEEWNAADRPYQLRLLLLTYSGREYLERALGNSAALEVVYRPPPDEFDRLLRQSWALFLPYSFAAEVRTMVRTSFPTKLVDCLPVGRPILVYGPPDASLPRHFRENGLPVCVSRREDLSGALRGLERYDSVDTIKLYDSTMNRLHSARHLRSLLACGGLRGAHANR